jgi:hypothetical protein
MHAGSILTPRVYPALHAEKPSVVIGIEIIWDLIRAIPQK